MESFQYLIIFFRVNKFFIYNIHIIKLFASTACRSKDGRHRECLPSLHQLRTVFCRYRACFSMEIISMSTVFIPTLLGIKTVGMGNGDREPCSDVTRKTEFSSF